MKKILKLLLSLMMVISLAGICLAQEKLKLSDEDLAKIAKMLEKEQAKKPMWSSLDIQFYGKIKLDAAYDTDRINTGDFARWVESDVTNHNDDEFNITANETRLGLNFTGPDVGDVKTSGKVEVDFFGSAPAENKAEFMMRHAYLKITWPDEDFSILAGQTWDVISPLNPSTLNYSVLWWVGNIGYRRPQIRATKGVQLTDDVKMKVDLALARVIGTSSGFDPGDSGEDTGFPGIQSRVGFTFPLITERPTTLGFSGHWAKEEYDTDAFGHHNNFDSWSANMDLVQPICKTITIKGELYTGQDLNAYLGGIGQGINTTIKDEIASTGGWIAADFKPCEKWKFTLGASKEHLHDNDLSDGQRNDNSTVFGNAIYSITPQTLVGIEVSEWHTERKAEGNADSLRTQLSFIYTF